MKIQNIFKHFKTVCVHRFWVCHYCFICGLYWQGLTHDLSKFSPVEFFESVKYYMSTSSPIDEAKRLNGYSEAWMHHKSHNKHHYEYWQDNFDSGTTHIKMPFKYVLEMVCDYLGAGRAYRGKTFSYKQEYEWWKNKVKFAHAMNGETKRMVQMIMYSIAKYDNLSIISKKKNRDMLKRIYLKYKKEK